MPGIEQTYHRILAYLKGMLSDRQRHELERDMMGDVFEEESFEGLSQLSAGELEADMDVLVNRLHNRVAPAKRRDMKIFLRLAAGVILLIGMAGILYLVLRTPSASLLTEEKIREKTADTAVPSSPAIIPAPVSSGAMQKDNTERKKISSIPLEHPVNLAENETKSKEETVVLPQAYAEERQMEDKLTTAEAPDQAYMKAAAKSAPVPKEPVKIITGTVVDGEGASLPGVNIMEKGTNNGTVTDMNGRFSLPLMDTGSSLALNYIGYKPLELNAGKKLEEKITMQEDQAALNEVIVVGYGTRRKRDATGALSVLEFDEDAGSNKTDQPILSKPVPPGGSLKVFRKWVNERLDYTAFRSYPGKQKIWVTLTVRTDGTISDIRTGENLPAAISGEFIRVIAQSPLWKPALRSDTPVEAEVAIRFAVTVE